MEGAEGIDMQMAMSGEAPPQQDPANFTGAPQAVDAMAFTGGGGDPMDFVGG
eukprot:CAMPEP_0176064944 /NCGR_PEP_ID=MMETSP0120_2-20121206/32396_1 /TAXON_ID=160619 /ORGANISM="Kryptoperidinium foliaceum, Strain CCMP 1326" /LENGTH=51 /DNA_ID=CAMNT_0017398525 /DNA_START=89 /DNA_END=240 /DNA_ORIENTATION=-